MRNTVHSLMKASLLPVLALLLCLQALASNGPDAGQSPMSPPSNAVGYMGTNGVPQFMNDRLVTMLPDGGSFYAFEFQTRANGLNMVRRGTNSAGYYLTETIPVSVDANNWIIVNDGEISCCYSFCESCLLNYDGVVCSCNDPNGSCTYDQNHPTRLVSDIVMQ